jgi:hypothetical protein
LANGLNRPKLSKQFSPPRVAGTTFKNKRFRPVPVHRNARQIANWRVTELGQHILVGEGTISCASLTSVPTLKKVGLIAHLLLHLETRHALMQRYS